MMAVLFNDGDVRLGETRLGYQTQLIHYGGLHFAPTTVPAELRSLPSRWGIAWTPISTAAAKTRMRRGQDCHYLTKLDHDHVEGVGQPTLVRLATPEPRWG